MNQDRNSHNDVRATFHGPVDGAAMIAVGVDIQQSKVSGAPAERLSDDEAAQLKALLGSLRAEVARVPDVDEKTRDRGGELVEELGTAATSSEPDLSTMEYVVAWFKKNIPALAGGVMSVVVNPIVGKLVSAAGEATVAEFNRRFGKD